MEKEDTKGCNDPKEEAEAITRTQEIIRSIIIIIIRIIEENTTTTGSRGMETIETMETEATNDRAVTVETKDIPSKPVGRSFHI